MDGLKISEAARATGFTVSALRFYEQQGVVVPERTVTGYRTYGEDDLDSLRFVARGKQLGLSLDDITELLDLLDDEECAPVQARIRHLVSERIGQAQGQIAVLVAFTDQLQTAADRLGIHTPEGACDDDCGCRGEPRQTGPTESATKILLARPPTTEISCALHPESVGARIEDWNRVLASAKKRVSVQDGVRLVFDRDVDVGALASLATAEQTCCSFFQFDIGIGKDEVALTVTGPEDAQPVITAVFGAGV
jgi:DNA-binding transcriptional MerR regulator